jgi:endonuclease/exonuclease/phosphatase family metal-dependent hydrolase
MLPLVFCGDFNFKPHSFPYKCITSGKHALDYASPHVEEHRLYVVAGWLAPELAPMTSLYAAVYGSEPAYTNNCVTQLGNSGENPFCDTLDYIFANTRVRAKGAELLPSEGPGLPNEHHPSDHLPVVVDVEID